VAPQGQQVEQRAAQRPAGQRLGGGAVGRDARGGQVLVHQPGVGLLGGEQDGHALQRRARPGGVDHGPHRGADLVVGVGRGEHPGGAGRHRPGGIRIAAARPRAHTPTRAGGDAPHVAGVVGQRQAEAGQRSSDAHVGPGHTGEPGDHRGGRGRGGVGEQGGGPPGEVLREVDHEVAQRGGRARPEGVAGRVDEVGLVVPARRQQRPRLAEQPHHVGRPGAGGGQAVERARRQVGQLTRRRDQRFLGGRVLGHGAEHAGLVAQGAAERGGDDRVRHGPAPRRRQGGSAQQLGQPERREERDADDARAPTAHRPPGRCQRPPGGDAHVVGGHDDRDRGERLVGLGQCDDARQGVEGRGSVCRPHELNRHAGHPIQRV
jgi:hypothetical protein